MMIIMMMIQRLGLLDEFFTLAWQQFCPNKYDDDDDGGGGCLGGGDGGGVGCYRRHHVIDTYHYSLHRFCVWIEITQALLAVVLHKLAMGMHVLLWAVAYKVIIIIIIIIITRLQTTYSNTT